VLGTHSDQISISNLSALNFTNAGTVALAEVLGRNQGRPSLNLANDTFPFSRMDFGNSRLKSLRIYLSGNRVVGEQSVAKKSLQLLTRSKKTKASTNCVLVMDAEQTKKPGCYAVCNSLKTHPLQTLTSPVRLEQGLYLTQQL
jgi:hypothetical protein